MTVTTLVMVSFVIMARQLSDANEIDYLRYPSWCLCRLLDGIVGTKEKVSLIRKCQVMEDYVLDISTSYKRLFSGSRGEGFTFLSSDFDVMYIDRHTEVLESIQNAPTDASKTLLLMKRDDCSPGFVILRLLNRSYNPYIREATVELCGHPVVSSLLYRDVHRKAVTGLVGNGPCNTYTDWFMDIDFADCFECEMWPSEAHEFIYRQRLHGWPQKSLLDKIICRGCHLVPIGDKNHDLSHIQWRLSFSAAEKELVHSFNHTQFLVYGLLKIFLKQFLNKFQSLHGILCSYFLKTLMFYSIETTPPSLWRDDLLIQCFWLCFNKLTQWVEQGYCPNYFVPQNNMFRGKVFGQNQCNLLRVLDQCKRSGWMCISLCNDLQLHENIVRHPIMLYSSGVMLNKKQYERDLDSVILPHVRAMPTTPSSKMHRNLGRILTLLRFSRTQQEKDISTILLYRGLIDFGVMNFCINTGINNKVKYMKTYSMLLISAGANVCTGSLYLATFYYITEQYRKTAYLCNHVISQWKPYIIYCCGEKNEMYIPKIYDQYVSGYGISTLQKAKSAYAGEIIIDRERRGFYPAELFYDIETAAPFCTSLPPIPYAVFLLFLCHHKLGNIDNSVTALHDLRILMHDEQQGCKHYPIILNMLAVCQEKLGDVHGAIRTCLYSQKLKPKKKMAQ